jgi:hypothetical protein
METSYKIRELKRKDRKIVSAMIVKLADKLGNTGVLNLISSAAPGSTQTPESTKPDNSALTIGIELIKLALTTPEDDVAAWFASLIGKTPEEFDDLPLDIEVRIIDQLRNAPEVNVFFSGAWQQYKAISKSGSMLPGAKAL